MMRIVRSGRKVLVSTRRQRQLRKVPVGSTQIPQPTGPDASVDPEPVRRDAASHPVDVAAREQDQRCDHLLKDRASVKLRQIERALRRLVNRPLECVSIVVRIYRSNDSKFSLKPSIAWNVKIVMSPLSGCAAESCSPSRFAHREPQRK